MNVSHKPLYNFGKRVGGKDHLHHSHSGPPSVHRLMDHENQTTTRTNLLNLGHSLAEKFRQIVKLDVIYVIVKISL
jgi:hypothetical protein